MFLKIKLNFIISMKKVKNIQIIKILVLIIKIIKELNIHKLIRYEKLNLFKLKNFNYVF